jgi:uncharacterized protein YbjQ (UPF0145 family)
MKFINCLSLAVALAVAPAISVAAKEKPKKVYVVMNEEAGVPVFAYDITDRPYTVIGEVKAGVRKATVFSKESSQGKIYRELWERAEKLDADAVVNAKYGESHITAFSWGKTNATGTAIKFTGTQTSVAVAPAVAQPVAVQPVPSPAIDSSAPTNAAPANVAPATPPQR